MYPIQTLKVGSLGTHNALGLAKDKKAVFLGYYKLPLYIFLRLSMVREVPRKALILSMVGSGVTTIEDLAKASLKLPSRIASIHFADNSSDKIKDSTWAVAYGLCVIGLTSDDESSGIKLAKKTGNNIIEWLKQFLP